MRLPWIQARPAERRDWGNGSVPEPRAAPRPLPASSHTRTDGRDKKEDSRTRTFLPVVVVGAGAAGLAAAAVLEQNNVPVLVLEARADRVGGRIHTVDLNTVLENNDNDDHGCRDRTSSNTSNVTVDVGAAWLDGVPGNPLYQYIREAGLETIPDNFRDPWFSLGLYEASSGASARFYEPRWMTSRAFRYLGSCQAKVTSEYQSMKDRIRHELPPHGSRINRLSNWFANFITEMNFAARPHLVHPNCWSINPVYDDDESVFLKGGYINLIDALSSQVPDIRLATKVTRIVSGTEDVQVHVESGEVFKASHVIVTVPLGVLQADCIAFEPGLSVAKKEAIGAIGFGSFEKMVLRFSQPFWRYARGSPWSFCFVSQFDSDAEEEADLPRDPFTFLDLSESAGDWVLVVLETSRPPGLSKEQLVSRVQRILQKQFPHSYVAPVQVYTTHWRNDPFARGSYSFPGLRTQRQHYQDVAAPEGGGRVLFAGEATSVEHSGYVGGAVESGVREARRILDFPAPLRVPAPRAKATGASATPLAVLRCQPLPVAIGTAVAVATLAFFWSRSYGRTPATAGVSLAEIFRGHAR